VHIPNIGGPQGPDSLFTNDGDNLLFLVWFVIMNLLLLLLLMLLLLLQLLIMDVLFDSTDEHMLVLLGYLLGWASECLLLFLLHNVRSTSVEGRSVLFQVIITSLLGRCGVLRNWATTDTHFPKIKCALEQISFDIFIRGLGLARSYLFELSISFLLLFAIIRIFISWLEINVIL
jgi:hypothetical protein